LQKNYYADMVERHEDWRLVDIYPDEGISGTSLKNRKQFLRMMEDCKAGKIDLVVTKSVSRFARNIEDFHRSLRELASLRPPVNVFFEMENMYSLDDNNELTLSVLSTIAQQESRIKSNSMNRSIDMRFQCGIYLTPSLLGYDRDEDGNLVINEEEAKTVRLCFFMYLHGYTCRQIAEKLTTLKRTNKKGIVQWAPVSVLDILQNERHCGSVLARKTWTPNYLDHKSKINRGERKQYFTEGHHAPIISRDDFIAVQHLIGNIKYGHKDFLPKLKVIDNGILKGFVIINPRWRAFTASDYQAASDSVSGGNDALSSIAEIEVQSGDFDLRGFEIVRSQFLNITRKLYVSFAHTVLWFSVECIRKFEKTLHVEILVHPKQRLFAVRPSSKESRNAIAWTKSETGGYRSRPIRGMTYLNAVYEICGWNPKFRYRIEGMYRQKSGEPILLFDMQEPEIIIPANESHIAPEGVAAEAGFHSAVHPLAMTTNGNVVAFPSTWSKTFGTGFYHHGQAQKFSTIGNDDQWNAAVEGLPCDGSQELDTTKKDAREDKIKQMICDMSREGTTHEEGV